jgi:hypothetical protein
LSPKVRSSTTFSFFLFSVFFDIPESFGGIFNLINYFNQTHFTTNFSILPS